MTEIREQHRSESRVEFLTKCQLEINGKKYNCLLGNISTTGAAVQIVDTEHDCIQVGNTGRLDVLLLSPVSYHCRIVRIDSNQIAVQFIDQ